MEIERKFLLKELPKDLDKYSSTEISQGYISTEPVVRIRQRNDNFYITIKSGGLMERIEVEKDITEKEFKELSTIVKGNVIKKTRYLIPFEKHTIELDVFHGDFEGLILAEIEFDSKEEADRFNMPDFFYKDVTENPAYQNSSMSRMAKEDIYKLLMISSMSGM